MNVSTRLWGRIFAVVFMVMGAALVSAPLAQAADGGGIRKICPQGGEDRKVENFIGRLWGYTDLYGVYFVVAGVVILGVLAAIPRARALIMSAIIPITVILLFGGVIITILFSISDCAR